jgi:hypothetical protein
MTAMTAIAAARRATATAIEGVLRRWGLRPSLEPALEMIVLLELRCQRRLELPNGKTPSLAAGLAP